MEQKIITFAIAMEQKIITLTMEQKITTKIYYLPYHLNFHYFFKDVQE